MSETKKKRCFTVMIVPHSEESTYSLRIPLLALQAVAAALVVCVAAVGVLGFAYLHIANEAQEAQTLRQINRAQQEEINALAIETERMMEQVQAIDELVELVTEKLELDYVPGESEVQGQTNAYNGSVQGAETILESDRLEYDRTEYSRLYSSRSASGGILERAAENIILLQNIVPEQTETLDSVGEYVALAEAKPSIWPARGRVASGFGMRRIPYQNSGYQFHTGVDIIGAYNSPIFAAASGRVTFTGYRGSYGNLIIIDHDHGYETYYAHLAGFKINSGDLVEKGDIIGAMGASGRTTGTHLHYEVQYNGSPVNPVNYMHQQ